MRMVPTTSSPSPRACTSEASQGPPREPREGSVPLLFRPGRALDHRTALAAPAIERRSASATGKASCYPNRLRDSASGSGARSAGRRFHGLDSVEKFDQRRTRSSAAPRNDNITFVSDEHTSGWHDTFGQLKSVAADHENYISDGVPGS